MKPLSVVGRVSRSALLALAALFLAVPSAHATKLKQQNLTQMIRDADSIVAGTVKRVRDGVDDKGVP